jgi:hypothetical protein
MKENKLLTDRTELLDRRIEILRTLLEQNFNRKSRADCEEFESWLRGRMRDYSTDDKGDQTRAEVSGVEGGDVEIEDEMDEEAENVM